MLLKNTYYVFECCFKIKFTIWRVNFEGGGTDFASSTKFKPQKFNTFHLIEIINTSMALLKYYKLKEKLPKPDGPCSLISGQVNLLNFIHEKSALMVNPQKFSCEKFMLPYPQKFLPLEINLLYGIVMLKIICKI